MSTTAAKNVAAEYGRVYLEYARKYLEEGDLRNARSTAEEGIRLTCGSFYIAVRDQLDELLEMIEARESPDIASREVPQPHLSIARCRPSTECESR
jgi:hypothetical protein